MAEKTSTRKRKATAAPTRPAKAPKRAKTTAAVTAPPFPSVQPTQRLDVYVFGRNDVGQLGLGNSTAATLPVIQLPMLNPDLAAGTVGVVHLAVGTVHVAALTYDNQILTWGVNIDSALGRNTSVENAAQDTPLPVALTNFPDGTVFTQLAATESATFVLTRTGSVYGWGTFRNSTGLVGFSPTTQTQATPVQIPGLANVAKIVAGAQHMLALTSEGKVFSWGTNEHNQLGRRRLRRNPPHHLVPAECCIPAGAVDISAGFYHSFAIHGSGHVYAWGTNDCRQTALPNSPLVEFPEKIQSLKRPERVISIQGGSNHSHAIDEGTRCLSWGLIENMGIGVNRNHLWPPDVIVDGENNRSILKAPAPVAKNGFQSLAIGIDHTVAITNTGTAYSWGLNNQHQAGQPSLGLNRFVVPTQLKSNDIDGKTLVFAGCGAYFSIVAGVYTPPPPNNNNQQNDQQVNQQVNQDNDEDDEIFHSTQGGEDNKEGEENEETFHSLEGSEENQEGNGDGYTMRSEEIKEEEETLEILDSQESEGTQGNHDIMDIDNPQADQGNKKMEIQQTQRNSEMRQDDNTVETDDTLEIPETHGMRNESLCPEVWLQQSDTD
ncbi:regulator of chromosome condensation 1/beta-lactamase-inhibitor protein II [Aspergillus pseudoustus]|uniref:Regulator of chromosome condensation 1/beta-lactamase-inhibitor protein II n=1 Tax=Aspergillus pseudoustus TaxID=1810923 RepID=A0ABR4JIN5_9EURO